MNESCSTHPAPARGAPCAIAVSGLSVEVEGRGGRARRLLSDISLRIPSGQFVAVIGPSGCGKSTLLKTLSGILAPARGEVLVAGHPVRELKQEFPLAVGYLPQFGAFHEGLTVGEILAYASALRLPFSVPLEVRENWGRHIMELARISPFLHQPYRTLSGGQTRRMALAEALIGDPAFLFLDELTSGLDPYSDREMMLWLRDLAHNLSKTVVLVTHAAYHLQECDSIVFLHEGRLVFHGGYHALLESHGADSITTLFEWYQRRENLSRAAPETRSLCKPRGSSNSFPSVGDAVSGERSSRLPYSPPPSRLATAPTGFPEAAAAEEPPPEPQTLKTDKPPGGWWQFPTLLTRQAKLFVRDRGQLWLHLALIVTFPCLVAVFATKGLPQVRNLTLSLEKNIVRTLFEQLQYLKESFHAASLVSGLAMFQVILLTLTGANNGAREIAKERDVLQKELRAGLSPWGYVSTKFLQITALCLIQAFWMAWFVKTVCGFPGSFQAQFGILFATTLAMSATCLAISAAAASPERASLLSIYLVGFQLPLSGAALSLPDWLSAVCRPLIAAYWGWSGYLKTLEPYRHYDIVKQAKETAIAGYGLSAGMLALHVIAALALAVYFAGRQREAA